MSRRHWRRRGSAVGASTAPSSRGSYRQLYTCLCVFGFHFFGSRNSHCSPAASSNSGSASQAPRAQRRPARPTSHASTSCQRARRRPGRRAPSTRSCAAGSCPCRCTSRVPEGAQSVCPDRTTLHDCCSTAHLEPLADKRRVEGGSLLLLPPLRIIGDARRNAPLHLCLGLPL